MENWAVCRIKKERQKFWKKGPWANSSMWAVVWTALPSSVLGSVLFICTVSIWGYMTRTWGHRFSGIFYKYLFPVIESYVGEGGWKELHGDIYRFYSYVHRLFILMICVCSCYLITCTKIIFFPQERKKFNLIQI